MSEHSSGVVGRATIGDAIHRQALRQPNKDALVTYNTDGSQNALTYKEVDLRAASCATGLRELGVQRGDVVAICAPNGVEYIVAYLGALQIGAAVTGVNWAAPLADIEWQIEHAGATTVVIGESRLHECEEILKQSTTVQYVIVVGDADIRSSIEVMKFSSLVQNTPLDTTESDVNENDIALLVYTSGSESKPKGVLIPHRNYLISTTFSLLSAGYISPDDVYLFVKPFHTIAGIGSITSMLLVGSTLVFLEAVTPDAVLDVVQEARITTISQTPTFYVGLTRSEKFATADFSSLRTCQTYGGLVSRTMLETFANKALHIRWASYWGQSELTQLGTIGWFRTFDDIPAGDPRWIGIPTPGLEVRIVDADGNDTDTGEMICRSPSVMAGYHNDAERTAETISNGWLHTGDIVHRDNDGNLFFFDRIKDMVKTGGMNVSSLEVEDALHQHPAISQAAVVGLPDEYWAEAVTGFVVLRQGMTVSESDVIDFCRGLLSAYKVPKRIVFLDALPVDAQGKIRKRELRALYSPG